MVKELEGITPPENDDILWRFMDFEKFVNILTSDSLFFTRADKFEDPYEGYKPEAIKLIQKEAAHQVKNSNTSEVSEIFDGDSQEKFLENWRRYVMCNCWYNGEEQSIAMWKIYAARKSGIAIKTTVGNLKKSLSNKSDVFIGKMNYSTDEAYELHYLKDLAFSPRSASVPEQLKKILYFPYFHKRKAYIDEKEIRLIIDSVPLVFDHFHSNYPEPATPDDLNTLINTGFPEIWKIGESLKVDIETLIGEVIISPYADDWL
ncbi:MAG: DUF2971 domain-containing protein [Candidatus Poribacteria bacterium]|nr:DUF2971 domain-containing protein [Candidatus Poribacteria bacterium]